jgi:hypothetical protein
MWALQTASRSRVGMATADPSALALPGACRHMDKEDGVQRVRAARM